MNVFKLRIHNFKCLSYCILLIISVVYQASSPNLNSTVGSRFSSKNFFICLLEIRWDSPKNTCQVTTTNHLSYIFGNSNFSYIILAFQCPAICLIALYLTLKHSTSVLSHPRGKIDYRQVEYTHTG